MGVYNKKAVNGMNEFSEFLYTLRKEKGLTQVQLADMLGVTNKAVSKWETSEAMPETAQLVPLAQILGVTVDELLRGERTSLNANVAQSVETVGSDENVSRSNEYLNTEKPKSGKWEKLAGLACAVVVALGISAYLIIGFTLELWHPYWVLAVLAGTSCVVIGTVFEFFDKEGCRWEMAHGKNVYTEGAGLILMMVCVNVYLFCGVFANLWHPLWIVFPVGGIASGIIGAIGHFFAKGERD